MKSLRLLLRKAREIRDQVRDVGVRQLVHLRARHDADVTVETVVDHLRHVLGRGSISVHQLQMRRIVEDLAEPRTDLFLVERADRMAGAALLPEQLLSDIRFALIDRDPGTAPAAARTRTAALA